ncbi:MAG TPA: tryptophan synthase subunit alpha [Chloroflexota bacterium]
MDRFEETFRRLAGRGELGVLPYFTVGWPSLDATVSLIAAAVEAGADGLELGVPFSDPVADGVTLQRASQVALANGATLAYALDVAARVRPLLSGPIVFMSYVNPVLAYGVERFAADAAEAGADGLIVPDLPPEEAGELAAALERKGLALIGMLAPTSTAERVAMVVRRARGFIYCVSLVGVTGARAALSEGVEVFLGRVREATAVPLVVGFGVSRPEHVRQLGRVADGVIVASALADAVERAPVEGRERVVRAFVGELKAASRAARSA